MVAFLIETRFAGDEKLTEHGLCGLRQLVHHHVSEPVAAFRETRGLLGPASRWFCLTAPQSR
jgi:hypothetical protein